MVAAVLGNEVNFRIGRAIGPRAFSGEHALAEAGVPDPHAAFYEKHGGKTIILSRFIPIIRTFAPFVAGVGQMQRRRFAAYNFVGGFTWVTLFIWGGYLFGNVPIIKENFGIVTIVIVVVSVLPVAWGLLKQAAATQRPQRRSEKSPNDGEGVRHVGRAVARGVGLKPDLQSVSHLRSDNSPTDAAGEQRVAGPHRRRPPAPARRCRRARTSQSAT